jgi:hypothetical protein
MPSAAFLTRWQEGPMFKAASLVRQASPSMP